MFRPIVTFVGILTVLVVPGSSRAQQADAPVYKDGDWWRVRVDVVRPAGVSIEGPQAGRFPEYVVKFESSSPKVIGVEGNESKETSSPSTIAMVLSRTGWRGDLLRFPLRVGVKWSDRFQHQPRGMPVQWAEGQYEVQAWEKIKVPKGEVDAIKIVLTSFVAGGPRAKGRPLPLTCTYFYAPAIKAIVSFNEVLPEANLKSTLVDFKVSD